MTSPVLSGDGQVAETRDVGESGQVDLVYAILEKANPVLSMALLEDEGICVACFVRSKGIVSKEMVIARTAIECVGAGTAPQVVVTRSPVEVIVASAAIDKILVSATRQRVVALATDKRVDSRTAFERIVADASVERVVALASD